MDVPEPPTGLNALLLDQLTFHWTTHLRPRLDGLTDHEYFWEPVPGCWSLRPRGEGAAPILAGGGELVVEFAHPAPDPPPVTTIAWRLLHLAEGVFGIRNAAHFGGPPVDFFTEHHPATAAAALERLDAAYRCWVAGVGALGDAWLDHPVGPAEAPYTATPSA